MDGPALQKRLAELGSTLPIIFLTGHTDIPTTVQAIKAGADDFLTKPVASDDLFRAIEKAFAHHQTLRGLQDKLDGMRARLGRLTPRERQVFDLVVRGNTNKQIARALGSDRAHHQGPPPQSDGENAGPDFGGTCLACRTGRRCVGYRTDDLGHFLYIAILKSRRSQSRTAGHDLRQGTDRAQASRRVGGQVPDAKIETSS